MQVCCDLSRQSFNSFSSVGCLDKGPLGTQQGLAWNTVRKLDKDCRPYDRLVKSWGWVSEDPFIKATLGTSLMVQPQTYLKNEFGSCFCHSLHVYTHIHIHVYKFIRIHIYTYTYTYTHTYTYHIRSDSFLPATCTEPEAQAQSLKAAPKARVQIREPGNEHSQTRIILWMVEILRDLL